MVAATCHTGNTEMIHTPHILHTEGRFSAGTRYLTITSGQRKGTALGNYSLTAFRANIGKTPQLFSHMKRSFYCSIIFEIIAHLYEKYNQENRALLTQISGALFVKQGQLLLLPLRSRTSWLPPSTMLVEETTVSRAFSCSSGIELQPQLHMVLFTLYRVVCTPSARGPA